MEIHEIYMRTYLLNEKERLNQIKRIQSLSNLKKEKKRKESFLFQFPQEESFDSILKKKLDKEENCN